MENEEFFRARDEHNRVRRALAKGKCHPKPPRSLQEERRKARLEGERAALKEYIKSCRDDGQSNDVPVNEFLQTTYATPIDDSLIARDFWKAVEKAEARFLVKNANKQYISALAYVAGMFFRVKQQPPHEIEAHIDALIEKSGMKVIKDDLQLLAAIHKVAIYQVRDTDKQKRLASSTVSRDIRAIAWLLSQRVLPADFVSYQESNGGGVDEWYRNFLADEAMKAAGSGQASREGGEGGDDAGGHGDEDGGNGDDVDYWSDDENDENDEDIAQKSRYQRHEGGDDDANSHHYHGPLKQSRGKAPECNCINPNICADRQMAHRFSVAKKDFLVTVHVGEESYAGARLIKAIKIRVPGPSEAMREIRLDRLLASLLDSGISYEV